MHPLVTVVVGVVVVIAVVGGGQRIGNVTRVFCCGCDSSFSAIINSHVLVRKEMCIVLPATL